MNKKNFVYKINNNLTKCSISKRKMFHYFYVIKNNYHNKSYDNENFESIVKYCLWFYLIYSL